MMHQTINRDAVVQLVDQFYGEIRNDDMLYPVFAKVIGDNWTPHLQRMVDFWSTAMLGSRSFQGNVYGKHMALAGIEPEHFRRWLALFEATAHDLFNAADADEFITLAHRIAGSLQLGYFDEVIVP